MSKRYKIEKRTPIGAPVVWAIRCTITDMIVGGNFERDKAEETMLQLEKKWDIVVKASDKEQRIF